MKKNLLSISALVLLSSGHTIAMNPWCQNCSPYFGEERLEQIIHHHKDGFADVGVCRYYVPALLKPETSIENAYGTLVSQTPLSGEEGGALCVYQMRSSNDHPFGNMEVYQFTNPQAPDLPED